MQAVDTSGVEPMSHPQDVARVCAPMSQQSPIAATEFQRIAPQTEAGLYLVPKVIE